MADKEPKYVAPTVYPEMQKYWDATSEAKLLVKHCLDCGEHHHYPRDSCPFCFSPNTEWGNASGHATIYSYSVMRRAAIPYVIAYVTLAEGPTMMSNIVGCDHDKLRIGQPVKLTFRPSEGGPALPMFTPA
ncbi:Zn-ribbon domain-containing OB-fold protein [Piscinibacter sakaiensis]|uniref:Zn-ribbon domain-containing OB-fold protein n=1 Tax=Piscinibacter sakaiensis TaxID=1547922 RepID=UPI003AAEED59